MKEAVVLGFEMIALVVGISAIIYGAVGLFWNWKERRELRRKIRSAN